MSKRGRSFICRNLTEVNLEDELDLVATFNIVDDFDLVIAFNFESDFDLLSEVKPVNKVCIKFALNSFPRAIDI
jgi:hypothetical protein